MSTGALLEPKDLDVAQNKANTQPVASVIARALELGEDDGFDLPSTCEELPRWKVESPNRAPAFTRRRRD